MKKEPTLEDLIEVAKFNFLSSRYEEAVKIWERALKLSPNDSQIYYNMGIAYESLNQLDKAKECFKKTVEIEPENQQAKQHLEKIVGA
jgi:tetratricopeptide (TPR) repeat protein